jgi:O-antigen/teichoic acid export membrane protein
MASASIFRSSLSHPSPELWALADQALISGMNFGTTILLARTLGVEQFGVFSLGWLVVLFVNSLQMSLVISPMISIGPKLNEDESSQYYAAVGIQQIALAALFAVGILLFATMAGWFLPHWNIAALGIPLAFAAFAYQLQDFVRRYFFVRSWPGLAFLNDVISYATQILLLLLIIFFHQLNTSRAFLINGVTSAAAVIVGALTLGTLRWGGINHLKSVSSRHWRFSKWLGASAVMQYATGNVFVVAASSVAGPGAAGVLRAAKNIMGITHIWFFGLENVMPAKASRAFSHGGAKELRSYIGRAALVWGGMTALFASIVSLAPGMWLKLIYGNSFGEYGYLLRWYAAAYVLIFLGLPLRSWLRALEYTKPIFWGYVVSSAFSLALAVPFTRYFGLRGAMAGLIGAQLLLHAVTLIGLVRRSSTIESPITVDLEVIGA